MNSTDLLQIPPYLFLLKCCYSEEVFKFVFVVVTLPCALVSEYFNPTIAELKGKQTQFHLKVITNKLVAKGTLLPLTAYIYPSLFRPPVEKLSERYLFSYSSAAACG